MEQVSLIEKEPFQNLYTLTFSGNDPLLQEHAIDVPFYASSISGYSSFLQCLAADIFKVDVEVAIIAEEGGSFKAVLRVAGKATVVIATAMTILQFFGIDAKSIKDGISDFQTVIIEEIIKEPTGLEGLIKRIEDSQEFTQEEKELLIEALKNKALRNSLDNLTKPLDNPGYSFISSFTNDLKVFTIERQHREKFKYIPGPEETIEPFTDNVRIVYLSPDLNKWMFKGEQEFWAEVLDIDFINRTMNKKSNELGKVLFRAAGRKITTRKVGEKRNTIRWEIDSIGEVPQQATLDMK